MVKKLIALFLVIAMTFALAACGGSKTKNESTASGVDSLDANTSESASEIAAASKDALTNSATSKTASATSAAAAASKAAASKAAASKAAQANRVTSSKSNGPSKATTTTTDNGVTITPAIKGLKVKEGKSLVDGLDFKGKTFTMAITEEGQYNTASFKRTIAAFETEYNCKISLKTLKFSTYNQQVTQALSAGNVYDICYAHGSMFPACAIDNLYNDLSSYLRTTDLMNDNDPTAGGIDLNKTSYFAYKNKIYGTCNYSSCFPYVVYYNKKAMADAGYSGSKDPRKLAESGKWTWNTILSMGRKLTDASANIYFLSNSYSGRGIMLAYGAPVVVVNNGVYKQNVTSNAYVSSLKMMQKLFKGNNRIAEPRDSAHAYNTYDSMLHGSCYTFTEETSKYLDMAKSVKSSSAFNRSKDNIGITTLPLGETNTKKLYPTGWLTAVCSGKGKNPLVAIAWDKFRSGYKDPVQDSNAMSKTDKAFTDGLLKGDICCEVGQFQTSDNTVLSLTEGQIIGKILNGADVASCTQAIKDQMTACINATMK